MYKTLTTLCCKVCSPGAGSPEILPRDLTTSAPRRHLCGEKLPSYISSPRCSFFKPARIFYSLHIDVSRPGPGPATPPPRRSAGPTIELEPPRGSEGRRNHRGAPAASGARLRAATRRRFQDGGGAAAGAGLSEAAAAGGAGPGRAEG